MNGQSHSSSPTSIEAVEETFSPSVISRTFTTASFSQPDTKITNIALSASIEYLRIFTREAVWRAEQASRGQETGPVNKSLNNENNQVDTNVQRGHTVLEEHHLESIAGTLVMDF